VPHGEYRLGATVGVTDGIKLALRQVSVPEDGVSGGHVLQFRRPDAVISGGVTVSNTIGVTGTVFVWGWSKDDAFVKTHVPACRWSTFVWRTKVYNWAGITDSRRCG
jgi:hypothetical protein